MPPTREQQEQAKQRRLREPIDITGYEITENRLRVAGAPKTRQDFATRRIETIGDLAKLDAHCKLGKFIPVPDLGLQALLIVLDKTGMILPAVDPGEVHVPGDTSDQ